jgi:hypothetical protein
MTHPIGTPRGLPSNAGVLAPAGWLAARGLFIQPDLPWHVRVTLGCAERVDVSLDLEISNDEWRYVFVTGDLKSDIRVTDVAAIIGHDDFDLMALAPTLKDFGALVRALEQRIGLTFQRSAATISTTISGSEPIIRDWLRSL